ncbi:MAG: hypothetical protein QM638_09110 [Nocardioides sp.]|uniref:hypothetical protein n=1 Tax=Nocardioides sp. TaxID=35761 RepID=UPI0039E290F7
MEPLYLAWIRLEHALALGLADLGEGRVGRRRDERGDVPGWVMVTLMTALICAGLLAIARPALKDMLRTALNTVK